LSNMPKLLETIMPIFLGSLVTAPKHCRNKTAAGRQHNDQVSRQVTEGSLADHLTVRCHYFTN
jgi:hypothetical protein